MIAVPSPCVQICKLQGDVCVGCGRTLREISEWPMARTDRRLAILDAAERRLAERRDRRS